MGLRESTIDVDAVSPIPASLASAVVEVAHEQGLADTWLNARAAAWRPRTLEERTCTPLLVRDSLVVLGVSADALLLMKLTRANEVDQADIRRVWPLCTFETAEQVVTSYYEAFPAEAPDPHLVDFVESLIGTVE